jgi:hypothetical protein
MTATPNPYAMQRLPFIAGGGCAPVSPAAAIGILFPPELVFEAVHQRQPVQSSQYEVTG